MSEQPTQPYSIERPTVFASDDELHLHKATVGPYDAAKIAEVRDAPIMRETTPEELNIMAIRNALIELKNLTIVRSAEQTRDN